MVAITEPHRKPEEIDDSTVLVKTSMRILIVEGQRRQGFIEGAEVKRMIIMDWKAAVVVPQAETMVVLIMTYLAKRTSQEGSENRATSTVIKISKVRMIGILLEKWPVVTQKWRRMALVEVGINRQGHDQKAEAANPKARTEIALVDAVRQTRKMSWIRKQIIMLPVEMPQKRLLFH